MGIILRKAKDFKVIAYCDADWGWDTTNRKSQTGFLIYLGGSIVSWVSKKQTTIAHFSTEAEYCTIATTAQKVEVVRALLLEMGMG